MVEGHPDATFSTGATSVLRNIGRNPSRSFAVFALLHAVVWTLLPSFLYRNLPLDLIEALTYGREWQLGYDKLPPLPWWLVEIVYRVSGQDFAIYAFAQIVVIAAFAAIWATALPIVGAGGALASVLIIDGMHYFNFTAVKFNHDVVQLPLWALAGFAFHRALRSGRTAYWALLGAAIGIALWAKYFIIILAGPLVLFLLIDPAARTALRTPGPFVAALLAIVVALPHLVWLVANDFLPFGYAAARAAPVRGFTDHLIRPVAFAGGQLLWSLPALIIAAPLFFPRRPALIAADDAFDRRIVTLLTFGPAATLVAMSAISGRGLIAMWGYPLWLFLGLWIVMIAGQALDAIRLSRMAAIWGGVTIVYIVAFIADYTILPQIDHRYRAVLFPGDRVAREIATRFHAETGRPLAYVIGSMWVGGNVSRYDPARPRVVIDGNPRRAPWIDLADLRRRGAALVWAEGDRASIPVEYSALAADARVQPPIELPMRFGPGTVRIGWAILPPGGKPKPPP
jgi:hypothetical protein